MNRISLYTLLVLLNLVDVGLTAVILERGGQEANPWVDMFIQSYGNVGMLFAKSPVLLLGAVIFTCWDHLRVSMQISTIRVMYFLNLVFLGVNMYSSFLLYLTFQY